MFLLLIISSFNWLPLRSALLQTFPLFSFCSHFRLAFSVIFSHLRCHAIVLCSNFFCLLFFSNTIFSLFVCLFYFAYLLFFLSCPSLSFSYLSYSRSFLVSIIYFFSLYLSLYFSLSISLYLSLSFLLRIYLICLILASLSSFLVFFLSY